MKSDRPLRVCFLFAGRGIGGAERSMLRLMAFAHPVHLNCTVILNNGPNPEMTQTLQELNIPYLIVPPFAWGQLKQAFIRYKPDLVYMFGQIRTLVWAVIARQSGISGLIGAERGSGTRWINRIGRRLDRYFLDAYISNTHHAAEALHSFARIPPDKLFVAHNGVEVVITEPREKPLTYGDPTIICVANIRQLKGQYVLVEAVAQLQSSYPEIKVVLLGKDLTKGVFFQEMDAKGWSGLIAWEGFVPDVHNYLPLADIFVLPTVTREGMPTAILEAMRAGLPVIGTNVGGVSELIQHGHTGIVVPPNDVPSLVKALEMLLESGEQRRLLAEAGATYIERNHTMQSMLDSHLKAFNYVLAA